MNEEMLKLNNISDENIEKVKKLVKEASELGFEFEDYDVAGKNFIITLKIKN
jgi:hypothetical protein